MLQGISNGPQGCPSALVLEKPWLTILIEDASQLSDEVFQSYEKSREWKN